MGRDENPFSVALILLWYSVVVQKLTSNVSGFFRSYFAHTIQHFPVSFVVSMREVETQDISTGIHQLSNPFFTPGGWPDGANDFRATLLNVGRCLNALERDVGTV